MHSLLKNATEIVKCPKVCSRKRTLYHSIQKNCCLLFDTLKMFLKIIMYLSIKSIATTVPQKLLEVEIIY